MTSNISFFSMVKSDLKRRIWAMALLFLGFFAALPLGCMMFIDSQQNQLANQYIAYEDMIRNLARYVGPANYGIFLVIAAAAILAAFTGFSYLQSSRKLDLFHSLPIARKTLFLVQHISGLLVFAIPYFICLVLLLIVCIVKTVCTAAVIASMVTGIVMFFLYFLLLYHVTLIAILLTGRILVSVLGLLVLCGYAFLSLQVVFAYFAAFFHTYYWRWDGLLDKVIQVFSPFYLYLRHTEAFSGVELESFSVFAGQWKQQLVLVVEIVILFLLSIWLYRKRPSEAAGHSMAFPKTEPVIKVLLIVVLSAAGGLIFSSLVEGSQTGWLVFGIVFCALVLHGVIEVIYSYEFKKVLAHKGTLFLSLGITLLLALAFRFDWFRYDTAIPAMDRLESIAVYVDGLGRSSYVAVDGYDDTTEYALNKGKMTDVEAGYRLAEAGVQNERDGLWDGDEAYSSSDNIQPVTINVAYGLSGGREKIRTYTVTSEQLQQCLPELYATKGFKEGHNGILNMDVDQVNIDYVEMYDAYHNGKINLSPEDAKDILKTYQQELEQAEYEELEPEHICGRLSVYRKADSQVVSNTFVTDVTVYDSFEKTMKMLDDLGYPMRKTPDSDEVTQITVYGYAAEWYQEDGQVYEDPQIEFTDKADIEEILNAAVQIDAPYFDIDSNYSMIVTVNSRDGERSNYMESSYQFLKDGVPDCVKEAFQNMEVNQD
ncbi:MAG: DUF6449 domain-containing protein [Ruminococcus sp.]|jgi:ABC-2 type transport system permease protein